ncbi:GH-E family nuclease [Rossellomorea sp. SC111]|uniref:GH-E family nuclease n=1 Tax=Rossellomorea sp. SC111 TaxID=2968985 RepID=UPI00215A63E9|nr:GH-E family nuclease [Rossellomorea sp. SC111]MCR8851116.1 GH-E family nuclease [Rossellomorea sp. SC111]
MVGFVPGLGAVAEGVNALIYAVDGDYTNAGLSLLAAIPIYGDGAKIGLKAGGMISRAVKGTNKRGQVTNRVGFRKKTVQNAWDNAEPGPNGGKLCPTCKNEVNVKPYSGENRDWDVDHTPAWTNREFPPNVTRKEVLDNYQEGTRLECPVCNRRRGNRDK